MIWFFSLFQQHLGVTAAAGYGLISQDQGQKGGKSAANWAFADQYKGREAHEADQRGNHQVDSPVGNGRHEPYRDQKAASTGKRRHGYESYRLLEDGEYSIAL